MTPARIAEDVEREQRLVARGAGFAFLASAIGAVANVAVSALMVRLLTRSDYGAVSVALAVATIGSGVATAGIGTSLARSMSAAAGGSDREGMSLLVRGAMTMILLFSGIGALATVGAVHLQLPAAAEGTRIVIGVGFAVFLLGLNAAWLTAQLNRVLGRVVLTVVPGLAQALLRLGCIGLVYVAGLDSTIAVAVAHGGVGALLIVLAPVLAVPAVRLLGAKDRKSVV